MTQQPPHRAPFSSLNQHVLITTHSGPWVFTQERFGAGGIVKKVSLTRPNIAAFVDLPNYHYEKYKKSTFFRAAQWSQDH